MKFANTPVQEYWKSHFPIEIKAIVDEYINDDTDTLIAFWIQSNYSRASNGDTVAVFNYRVALRTREGMYSLLKVDHRNIADNKKIHQLTVPLSEIPLDQFLPRMLANSGWHNFRGYGDI